jgi:transcriptional regulator of acetoin/glycerol metabolism
VPDSARQTLPLSEIVKDAIRGALESSEGDISKAAKELDLPENTVREKAAEYGLRTTS